jgi:hypothetical protein
MICEVAACACSGQKECTPGCAGASDCGEGQVCGADHRCTAQACYDGTCPSGFDCVIPFTGPPTCQRRNCANDAACGGGSYCVDGACFGSLGTCSPLPS